MTPERVVSLLVALAPVLSIVSGIVIVVVQKNHNKDKKNGELKPVLGIEFDPTEFADEAIAAIKEQRDIYKERSRRSEDENQQLRKKVQKLEEELRDARHALRKIEHQASDT